MWYAVWVRSGQEDRILELCKTFRHYHPDAYEECFIPTYEKYRKVNGQPTKQLAHLLPGYIFFVSDHPQELQKLFALDSVHQVQNIFPVTVLHGLFLPDSPVL